MPEFYVNEEADVHEAECYIEDRYVVAHKDAIVIRQITYTNNSSSKYPIALSAYQLEYFLNCEDFKIQIDGKDIPFNIKDNDFSKIITFDNSYDIPTRSSLTIIIKCIWKNFIIFLDDCFFRMSYPEKATYKLVIEGIALKDKKYIIQKNNSLATLDEDFYEHDNSLRFEAVTIDNNTPFRAQLLLLSTPKKLNTLSYYLQGNGMEDKFSEYIIFIIQHLLSDFVHSAEALNVCGVPKDHMYIIGIPYSTKEKTAIYLRKEGYKNIQTPTDYPFDDIVKSELEKAMQLAEETGKKILIIEDGGYAVPLIHKELTGKAHLFVGAVEQTANGIWRNEKLAEDGIDYLFPIINVADSEIKDQLESPLIGQAVCKNLENHMGQEFTNISGKYVGLVGFGRTGTQIASVLSSMGAKIKVFADNKTAMMRAYSEGYITADSYTNLVENCKIVIEATGHKWADKEVIMAFEHGTWFVSASSKQMGIDYDEFHRLIKQERTINLPGLGKRYELNTGNNITLIADGFPINFFNSESVPDKKIEFIPALLFKGAEFIIDNVEELEKGIIEIEKNEKLKEVSDDIANTLYVHREN